MKNLFFTLTLVSLFIISSCSTKDDNNILNSINQQDTTKGAHQITNLNLFDNKETFSTWFGDSVDSEDKNYSLLIANNGFLNGELINIVSIFEPKKKKSLNEINILGSVLYSTKHYLPKGTFSLSDINGVLIFFIDKNEKLYAKTLIKKGNSYNEVKGLSSRIKNITFDDIYSISELIPRNKSDLISAIVLFNKNLSYSSSWFTKNYSKTIEKYKKSISFKSSSCDKPCRFPCDGVFNGNRCIVKERPIGEKYNCSCICAGKSTIKESNNIGLKVFFNENDLYVIRDEFLYESKKGKKYIDYYYKLSDHFQGNISISDVRKIIDIGNKVIPKLGLLNENNNFKSQDPIINKETENDLLNLINTFKGKTKDKNILNILNEIKRDMKKYSNVKSKEFKTKFNSDK